MGRKLRMYKPSSVWLRRTMSPAHSKAAIKASDYLVMVTKRG
jgi:hypothetical protein